MQQQSNKKPLQDEIDNTYKIINDQYSHMKTTCKAFIAFFKQLTVIEKQYADSLQRLTETAGDKIGLKESLNGCLEFENATVSSLISNTTKYLLRISHIHSEHHSKITDGVIQPINDLYLECKSMKSDYLKSINTDIKITRDSYVKKQKTLHQSLVNYSKKTGYEQKMRELQIQQKQLNQEIEKFEQDSLIQLTQYLDTTEKQEQIRTNELKMYINNFLNSSKSSIAQTQILSQRVEDNIKNMAIDLDVSLVKNTQSLVKTTYQNSVNDSNQNKKRRNSIDLSNTDEFDEKLNQQQLVLEKKISDMNVSMIKKRQNKIQNDIMYQSFVNREVPKLIADHEGGIYHEDIPNNHYLQSMDINQYSFTLMSLVNNYGAYKIATCKDQKEEMEYFVQHTMNKLKIKQKDYKLINKNFTFAKYCCKNGQSQQNNEKLDQIMDLYSSTEDQQKILFCNKFIKSNMAFAGINSYWKNILLPDCLGQTSNQQWQQRIKKDIDLITSIYNTQENGKIISMVQQLEQSELLHSDLKMSFPLNYTFAKFLLNSVLDQSSSNMFIEDWEDHYEILLEFVEEVLNIPKSNFYLLFISFCHDLFLKRGLIIKEPQTLVYLKQMTQVLIKGTKNLKQEQSQNQNTAQRGQLNSNLDQILKFTISDKPFKDMAGILKSFWEYIPNDINLVRPLTLYFFSLGFNQIGYTFYSNMEELVDSIFSSAGLKFGISYYLKSQFNPKQKPDKNSPFQITDILERINNDLPQIYLGFIPNFCKCFVDLLGSTQQKLECELNITFIQSMISEIIRVIELIINEELIPLEDKSGIMFNLCMQLSKLDDILIKCDPSRDMYYYQYLGKYLNEWLGNMEYQQKEILHNCIQSENWTQSADGNKQYSNWAIDFCSIMFKQIDIMKQLLKFSEQNPFKKIVQSKLHIMLHQTTKKYVDNVSKSLKCLNIEPIDFHQYTGRKSQYVEESEEEQLQHYTNLNNLCLRIGNLDLLINQLTQTYQQYFTGGSDLLVDLKQEIYKVIDVCIDVISRMIVSEYCKNTIKEGLYADFDLNKFNLNAVDVFQQVYQNSFYNISREIEDYFKIILKRIPKIHQGQLGCEIVRHLSNQFAINMVNIDMFDSLQLNHNKFSEFLQLEIQFFKQFVSNIFKQQQDIQVVLALETQYLIQICCYYDQNSQELMDQFENYSMQDDNFKSGVIYRILFMRRKTSDKKVQDLVKKFKKMYLGVI